MWIAAVTIAAAQHASGRLPKTWRDVPVVVTGGVGFIGSNLVRRLLAEGATVTIVDSFEDSGGANTANLRDLAPAPRIVHLRAEQLPMQREVLDGCRCVFHLAAATGHVASMQDPVSDLSANALGTAALLQAVRAVAPEARVVFTSTRQVYGTPEYQPVDERHPVRPPDVNAIGKICAEQLLSLFGRTYGLRCVTLRLTNTFGPRMRIRDARQMFLGLWIRNLIEGNPIVVFGDGRQRRDFLHVDDVVDALLLAARDDCVTGIYNLGSEDVWALGDLASYVCRLGSNGSRVERRDFPADRRDIDVGDFVTDGSVFRAATGWSPSRSLIGHLGDVIEYFRAAFPLYTNLR